MSELLLLLVLIVGMAFILECMIALWLGGRPTSSSDSESRDERIANVGPVELRGRRREEDDPTRKAIRDLRDAFTELGEAVAETFHLDRLADWLHRKIGPPDSDTPDQ